MPSYNCCSERCFELRKEVQDLTKKLEVRSVLSYLLCDVTNLNIQNLVSESSDR